MVTHRYFADFCLICSYRHYIEYFDTKRFEVRARIELAAFCVLGRCDNHYTTEPVLILMPFLAREFRFHTYQGCTNVYFKTIWCVALKLLLAVSL